MDNKYLIRDVYRSDYLLKALFNVTQVVPLGR